MVVVAYDVAHVPQRGGVGAHPGVDVQLSHSLPVPWFAQGIAPSAVDVFLSRSKYLKKLGVYLEGKKLEDDKIHGVALSTDLARLLDLKPGSDAVAMSTTVDGQMNALDMEVFNLFDVGIEELNDKVMQVPFRFAQTLYDTDGADRITVLLDEIEYTGPFRDQLRSAFRHRGLNLYIKTWKELSQWYREVKNMFDVIFLFLFIIVFVIVVMTIVKIKSVLIVSIMIRLFLRLVFSAIVFIVGIIMKITLMIFILTFVLLVYQKKKEICIKINKQKKNRKCIKKIFTN